MIDSGLSAPGSQAGTAWSRRPPLRGKQPVVSGLMMAPALPLGFSHQVLSSPYGRKASLPASTLQRMVVAPPDEAVSIL
jgi:hypothetical protein